MSTNHQLKDINDQNALLDDYLRRFPGMNLKKYKIIKNGILSIMLVGFGTIAISQGADPTVVSGSIIALVAVLNGIEFSELFAVYSEMKQAQAEAQQQAKSEREE